MPELFEVGPLVTDPDQARCPYVPGVGASDLSFNVAPTVRGGALRVGCKEPPFSQPPKSVRKK
jgi:hypothetical protein